MDLLYAWVASIASGIGPIIQYAEEHGFSPKSECHFTIIGRHMGDALMVRPQSVSTEERRLLEDRLHTLVLKRSAAYEWSVFHQQGVVDGLDEFYRHVTLFTKGNGVNSSRGIGIASAQAFADIEHWPIQLAR